MSSSRTLANQLTSFGYLLSETESKGVNKTFLANTIRDVDTHNRKEQEDSCWRAHRLQKQWKLDDEDREKNSSSQVSAERNDTSERELWALRKLEAFAKQSENGDASQGRVATEGDFKKRRRDSSDSESCSSSSSSESSYSSGSSDDSTSRHRKRKRKSEKKSKSKRHRSKSRDKTKEKKRKSDKKKKDKKRHRDD